jgi:hypothetical protein
MPKIAFDEPPPYEPLTVETAAAEHQEGEVELVLTVDTGETVRRVVPILLRLTVEDAKALASQIVPVAMTAHQWLKAHP